MELLVETIIEARGEEMKFMSEKTFEVVRMSEAYRVTGKGLLSTKWVELIRYVISRQATTLAMARSERHCTSM